MASLALIKPMPAVTAANAPTKSGAPPLRIWMPTLDNVATIVRIPSAVVLMYVWGYRFLRHFTMIWLIMLYSETILIASKITLLLNRTHQSSSVWKEVISAREEAMMPVNPLTADPTPLISGNSFGKWLGIISVSTCFVVSRFRNRGQW